MHTSFIDERLGCSSAVEQDAVNVLVGGSIPPVPASRDTRTINQVAKDAELAAAYERIAELTATLVECREFAEDYVDIVDSDSGPAPNKAMRLVTAIDESLYGMLGSY